MEAALHEVLLEHSRRAASASSAAVDVHTKLDDALGLDLDRLDEALAALAGREAGLVERLSMMREAAVVAAAAELPELHSSRDALAATGEQMNALAAELLSSSASAAASCASLRAMHAERERVLHAAHVVDELLGLEACAGDVDEALARNDFAAAVARVAPLARAVAATEAELPPAGAPAAAPPALGASAVGGTADSTREGERAAEVVTSLRKRVADELARAAESGNDVGAVCGLAKLMGPLGRAAEGREALQSFALRQLDAAAAEGSESAETASVPALVSAALGRLLQRCAALLESADGAVDDEMGGAEARSELALALRDRCVEHGARLGARFNAASGLKSLVDDGSRRLRRANEAALTAPAGGAIESIDADGERAAAVCEGALDAMCALLRGVTQFDAYMKGRTGGDGTASGETLRHAKPFSEMARATISLGHFWAFANVGRAVRAQAAAVAVEAAPGAEGAEGGEAGVTEMVDSAFYVLQTSLRRAAHTCDGGIATAAVKHAVDLLRKLLLAELQGQLKQSVSSKLAGAALAGAQNITRSAAEGIATSAVGGAGASLAEAAGLSLSAAGASRQLGLLRTLSALELCVSYAPRLWRDASGDFARSLPPSAITPAQSQLVEAEGVVSAFESALDSGLQQLSSALFPRLRSRLDAFGAASYTLQTEAAFAAAEGDTFVAGLMTEMELVMRPLSPGLAEGARERLLQMLLQACAERIETLVLAKRFDQLGALQLDRDVRALTKRLGELSSRSVRERTARLTQMCTLLNLETEAEAVGMWAAEGYEWRLTAAEAKRVLALRIDFRTDVINALALA